MIKDREKDLKLREEEALKLRFEKITEALVHQKKSLSELLREAIQAKEDAEAIKRDDLVIIAQKFINIIDALARKEAGDIIDC